MLVCKVLNRGIALTALNLSAMMRWTQAADSRTEREREALDGVGVTDESDK
jgi:hypothetical protein